tara:strand:+ start:1743 stop:1901 length:159 start_codon:yes stop_codon:yes gene_type:complete
MDIRYGDDVYSTIHRVISNMVITLRAGYDLDIDTLVVALEEVISDLYALEEE